MLKPTQGLAMITMMLGAALSLELQTGLNPDQLTAKATPLLGEA